MPSVDMRPAGKSWQVCEEVQRGQAASPFSHKPGFSLHFPFSFPGRFQTETAVAPRSAAAGLWPWTPQQSSLPHSLYQTEMSVSNERKTHLESHLKGKTAATPAALWGCTGIMLTSASLHAHNDNNNMLIFCRWMKWRESYDALSDYLSESPNVQLMVALQESSRDQQSHQYTSSWNHEHLNKIFCKWGRCWYFTGWVKTLTCWWHQMKSQGITSTSDSSSGRHTYLNQISRQPIQVVETFYKINKLKNVSKSQQITNVNSSFEDHEFLYKTSWRSIH